MLDNFDSLQGSVRQSEFNVHPFIVELVDEERAIKLARELERAGFVVFRPEGAAHIVVRRAPADREAIC